MNKFDLYVSKHSELSSVQNFKPEQILPSIAAASYCSIENGKNNPPHLAMFTVFLLRNPGRKVYKLGKPMCSKDQEIEDRVRNLKHKMISKDFKIIKFWKVGLEREI